MSENTLTLASSAEDASAAEVLRGRHAEWAGGLTVRVEALQSPGDAATASRSRSELVEWMGEVLVPALAKEADVLSGAVASLDDSSARSLLDTLLAGQRRLEALVVDVRHAASTDAAVGAARAFAELLESRLRTEDDVLVPLLAAAPGVSLVALVDALPAAEPTGTESSGGHHCSCGEHEGEGHPELDARAIPHAIRHATIFGALDGVAPGAGMVLVAPHDPLPLLAQLEQRQPGAFEISYLERGPEAWRLQFVRRG